RATKDLLRWRTRVADRKGDRAAKGYEGLPFDPLQEKSLTTSSVTVANRMRQNILGKRYLASELARGAGGIATSTAENRSYTQLRSGRDANLSDLVTTIKRDLLATDAPPLSYDGAVSLAETTRGDVVRAGGVLEHFELEPLLYRFKEISAEDGTLAKIGP